MAAPEKEGAYTDSGDNGDTNTTIKNIKGTVKRKNQRFKEGLIFADDGRC